MLLHAHVAFVNVLARNRTQVFVAGVLVQPIAGMRPADLIVKFAHLLFCIFGHGVNQVSFRQVRWKKKEVQSFHVNGSPTKNLNVSPNCAMPSALSTFSTGQTSRSSQKFISR